jgi:hypothetical protein
MNIINIIQVILAALLTQYVTDLWSTMLIFYSVIFWVTKQYDKYLCTCHFTSWNFKLCTYYFHSFS